MLNLQLKNDIFFLNSLNIGFIFPLFLYAFPIPLCLSSQIISHFLQFFTFRSIHLFYFYVYAYFINNYWLFYFFAFQKLSSFQVSPSNPHSKSPPFWFYEGVCPPMHPLPPYCSNFFLSNGTKPSQNLVPPLPLMPDKPPLCYICCWSHGSLYVYSLVGVFVPVSSGVSSWLISLIFLLGCNTLQLLCYFFNSPTGVPVLIQWLPANICNCISQVLIVSFRRHP